MRSFLHSFWGKSDAFHSCIMRRIGHNGTVNGLWSWKNSNVRFRENHMRGLCKNGWRYWNCSWSHNAVCSEHLDFKCNCPHEHPFAVVLEWFSQTKRYTNRSVLSNGYNVLVLLSHMKQNYSSLFIHTSHWTFIFIIFYPEFSVFSIILLHLLNPAPQLCSRQSCVECVWLDAGLANRTLISDALWAHIAISSKCCAWACMPYHGINVCNDMTPIWLLMSI